MEEACEQGSLDRSLDRSHIVAGQERLRIEEVGEETWWRRMIYFRSLLRPFERIWTFE